MENPISLGGAFTMWANKIKYQVTKVGALVSLTFLLLLISAQGLAQSMEFTPDFNRRVTDIVIQADGKILVAGNFVEIDEVSRRRLARLNGDGSVDENFNPRPNNYVFAIAVLANDQILVGGSFTSIGGTSGFIRNRLAKLNSDGTVDASFNPNVNGSVNVIAVQANGKILFGGSFTEVDGIARKRIARLNVDGSLDLSFDPDSNSSVNTIALQPNGDILIGGTFTSVGGVARNRLAQLDAAGTIDLNFDPDVNNTVNIIAIQADGRVLVGGLFSGIGQFVRSRLARLEANGSVDVSYNPVISGPAVEKIALQNDGKVIAAGLFNRLGVPSVQRTGIARINNSGSVDKAFNAELNDWASGLALQEDGKILVGGEFTEAAKHKRRKMARLNADGSLEQLLDDDACAPILAKNGAIAIICL